MFLLLYVTKIDIYFSVFVIFLLLRLIYVTKINKLVYLELSKTIGPGEI
jgi:hypothetical protein